MFLGFFATIFGSCNFSEDDREKNIDKLRDKYDYCTEYGDLFIVKKNNKCGLVTIKNKVLQPIIYDSICPICENRIVSFDEMEFEIPEGVDVDFNYYQWKETIHYFELKKQNSILYVSVDGKTEVAEKEVQEFIKNEKSEFEHILDTTIYKSWLCDKPAQYKGGEAELMKFIDANLELPSNYSQIHKVVSVEIVINRDGTLSDIHVEKSVNDDLDKEALRVVELTKNDWTPADIFGNKVHAYDRIDIFFEKP